MLVGHSFWKSNYKCNVVKVRISSNFTRNIFLPLKMNKLDGKAGLYSKDYLLARGHCEWILGRLMELSLTPIRPELSYLHLLSVVVKVHRSSTWVKVQIRIIKYYSIKSKSTAFSILLEWKYKSTQFFMYLSKKVLIDRFILQFYIDYFISFYISTYFL